jgi:hypothetical protein
MKIRKNFNCLLERRKRIKRETVLFSFLVVIAAVMFMFAVYISGEN